MPSLVQFAGDYQGTGGTCFPALTGVTAGNTLVIIARSTGGAVLSEDTGTYAKAFGDRDEGAGGGTVAVLIKQGVAAGAHTRTVSATTGNPQALMMEFSGLGNYRTGTVPMQEGFSSSAVTASLTPFLNEYLLGIILNLSAVATSAWSPGTKIAEDNRAVGIAVAEYVAPSTSPVSFSATLAASAFFTGIVLAFSPLGVVGPPVYGGPTTGHRRFRVAG